jgi:hypothetical protein
MTPPEDPFNNLVKEYVQLKQWQAKAKTRELELRNYFAQRMFADKKAPDGAFLPGTLKAESDSVKFKLVHKRNYTVLEDQMTAAMKAAELTTDQRKSLLRTTYELSLTAYKALSDKQRAEIDRMLVIKPAGTVELELEVKV